MALMQGPADAWPMTTTETTSTGAGYALAPGDGERLWIVGDTMTFKATGESTGGALMLLENVSPPGSGPPPHVHVNDDEFFYVLEGTFEILVGDTSHRVGPGGFAFVPHGTVHRFQNVGEQDGRILVGFTPGGIEGFFRESGRPATDDGPAPPFDEDELARTMEAAPRYGLELLARNA